METTVMSPRIIAFIILIMMPVGCGSQNTAQQGNAAPSNTTQVNALSALKPAATSGAQASPQAIVTRPTKTAVLSKETEPGDSDDSSVQEPDIAPISEDQ